MPLRWCWCVWGENCEVGGGQTCAIHMIYRVYTWIHDIIDLISLITVAWQPQWPQSLQGCVLFWNNNKMDSYFRKGRNSAIRHRCRMFSAWWVLRCSRGNHIVTAAWSQPAHRYCVRLKTCISLSSIHARVARGNIVWLSLTLNIVSYDMIGCWPASLWGTVLTEWENEWA
jgi:hypothetical protein